MPVLLLPENLIWFECVLRVFIAMLIGFALGVERQLRLKVTGIRIHVVVAAGAALFTIVSLYAFGETDTRVAAQIVTGIGFIGAGAIMHRQNAVHGLSSAAGIWLTAAIAMATGAGMYLVAAITTVLTILIQLFLHLPLRLFKEKHHNEVTISFKCPTEDCLQEIKKMFGIEFFTEFKAERNDGEVIYNAMFQTKKQVNSTFIRKVIAECSYIISIEKTESDQ